MSPEKRQRPAATGRSVEQQQAKSEHRIVRAWRLVGAATRRPGFTHGDVAVLWSILDRIGEDTPLAGEGALLAAVNAQRTGRMGDIVGTIQAEQDEAIRAPYQGVTVIGGGEAVDIRGCPAAQD